MTKHLMTFFAASIMGLTVFLPVSTQAGFIEYFYHEAGLPQANLTAAGLLPRSGSSSRKPHSSGREAIGKPSDCDRGRLRLQSPSHRLHALLFHAPEIVSRLRWHRSIHGGV